MLSHDRSSSDSVVSTMAEKVVGWKAKCQALEKELRQKERRMGDIRRDLKRTLEKLEEEEEGQGHSKVKVKVKEEI